MSLEKPSDNELRRQISKTNFYFYFFVGLAIFGMVGYMITDESNFLFIFTTFLIISALVKISEIQDKIRLEIRELSKK